MTKDELRCLYTNKPCHNPRSAKNDGGLHRFCTLHRNKAKEAQIRWRSRKRGVKVTDAAVATTVSLGVVVATPPPPSQLERGSSPPPPQAATEPPVRAFAVPELPKLQIPEAFKKKRHVAEQPVVFRHDARFKLPSLQSYLEKHRHEGALAQSQDHHEQQTPRRLLSPSHLYYPSSHDAAAP